ncbi:acyl-CoA thioester hydrolase [Kineococcus xinjiangensis]|uniref:Acyl-CoA thioester hydrolase n=2 Tax=Kineococcus xinjiangensis TaxID=512762 RepID=A0A2S6IHY8_9ACTN|nr:acyl-CoA thioester hydrolase [Kineococcus xinjiangensis]
MGSRAGTGAIASATCTTRVEWVDTDASGHHHNTAVIRWVEECEARMFRDLGLLEHVAQAPRVRLEVNFRAPLHFGQEITTELRLERLGERSMSFSFRVWGGVRDEEPGGAPPRPAADGLLVTACVPPGATVAAPWPEHLRRTLLAAGGTPPAP